MEGKTLYKCTLCLFSTKYKPNLLRHIQLRHQPIQVFRCDFCNFNATNAIHLNLHKFECPANKELPTPTLNFDEEEAPTKEILNAFVKADNNPSFNITQTTKDKPLRLRTHHCTYCEYSTINSKEFLMHRAQIHGEALTIYECEYCSYATDSPGNIKRHTIVHQRNNTSRPTEKFNSRENHHMAQNIANNSISDFLTQNNLSPQGSHQQNSPRNTYCVCIYCKFRARNRNELMEHNKIFHSDKKLYQCSECKFNTNLKTEYVKHCVKHKSLHKKCKLCTYSSPYVYNVIRHMKSHHPEYEVEIEDFYDEDDMSFCELLEEDPDLEQLCDNSFELIDQICELCGYTTHTKDDLDNHIRTSHHSSSLQEKVSPPHSQTSPVATSSNQSFLKNMAKVSSEANISPTKKNISKKFKCIYCLFVTTTEDEFQAHMEEHVKKNLYYCSTCSFQSSDHLEVRNHIESFKNNFEEFSLNSNDHLNAQVVILEDHVEDSPSKKRKSFDDFPKEKLFYCSHCDFKNIEKRSVISHLGIHANLTPFFCNACGYSSNWQHTVISHIKARHGPYVDQYLYHRISYLVENHFVSLTAIYPEGQPSRGGGNQSEDLYKCDSCPYETDRYMYLKRHQHHHTQKPEFKLKCRYCPFYASMLKTIQQHERYHTEISKDAPVQNFKCESCPFTSEDSQKFTFHKKFHEPNNDANYACTYCTYWANDITQLTKHVKLHAHEKINSNSDTNVEMANLDSNSSPPKAKFFKQDSHFLNKENSLFVNEIQSSKLKNAENPTLKSRINEAFKYFKYLCVRCPAIFKSNSNLAAHARFHGANLPFPCTQCDYSAKSLIYLKKHQFVHTTIYNNRRKSVLRYLKQKNEQTSNEIANNEAQYATKSFITYENVSVEQPPELRFQMESRAFDQMLLLEETETKSYISGEFPRPNQKFKSCKLCPAIFCNPAIFAHHLSLHNSSGKYGCFQCSYATDSKVNLETHLQLHSMKARKELSKAFKFCPKCPAIFFKQSELEHHLKIHKDGEEEDDDDDIEIISEPSKEDQGSQRNNFKKYMQKNHAEMGTNKNPVERKTSNKPSLHNLPEKFFGCSLCPFYNEHQEKLNIHYHQHKSEEGIPCFHCNYMIPTNFPPTDHLVMHYQSPSWAHPQAFLKYNDVKINIIEKKAKKLLFDSKTLQDSSKEVMEVDEDKNIIVNNTNNFIVKDNNEKNDVALLMDALTDEVANHVDSISHLKIDNESDKNINASTQNEINVE